MDFTFSFRMPYSEFMGLDIVNYIEDSAYFAHWRLLNVTSKAMKVVFSNKVK